MKRIVKLDQIKRHIAHFEIDGDILSIEPFGRGHLHQTYLVLAGDSAGTRRYIVQQVNTNVFSPPELLASNTHLVLQHQAQSELATPWRRIDSSSTDRLPQIVSNIAGGSYTVGDSGELYRAFTFVEGGESVDRVRDANDASEAGRLAAWFFRAMATMDINRIQPILPGFQDTAARCLVLEQAVAKDPLSRSKIVGEELAFARKYREIASIIGQSLRDPGVGLRITHGDMKLNNILFDINSRKAICFVDLDTVMPGSLIYDFGDLVRTAITISAEDERDLDKVNIDPNLFDAVASGFFEIIGTELRPREIELLPIAPASFVITTGIRFLTDFILGDVYFGCSYDHHNLDRCRSQFQLAKRMLDAKEHFADTIRAIV